MRNFDITELIPQRAPIVMVDNLIFCNDTKSISHFLIQNNNIFCEDNFFTESGLIENIAQTAAARMGYLAKQKGGQPLIGYIGAIKNLHILFKPPVNSRLTTEINITNQIMDFTVISGSVKVGDETAATCEMRIFLLKK